MKPITAWIQHAAIDQLVEAYGAHLEKLSQGIRRDIIACLANDAHYWAGDSEDIDEVWVLVEHLTRYEKDKLVEAIAASLVHHGNPWLENARATVAIAQKEGTSSH